MCFLGIYGLRGLRIANPILILIMRFVNRKVWTMISSKRRGLKTVIKLTILIYLYKEGRKKKKEIYEVIPSNSRRAEKLNELEEQGLILQDKRKFENNVTYVELTELGKLVARKLYEIEMFMSGENQEDAEEKRIEQEVEKRVAERIAEMDEDEISTSGAIISIRDEEKEED